MAECQRCGVVIPPYPGRGRPRKWCSERCKRDWTGPANAERIAKAAAEFSPGTRFHRLTVLAYHDADHVEVRCDCGTEKVTRSPDLRAGTVKSCGCLRRENPGSPPTHGLSGTPEYFAWRNIKHRIFNPNNHAFRHYGGRGLTMEPEWVNDFAAFYAEVGPRPAPHFSIDRIDNDLGYVKGNLRWATPAQQTANRRAA